MPDEIEGNAGCLGVVHVPKTGGVSLRSTLAQLPGCYSGPLYFDEPYFGSMALVEGVPSPNRETIASQSDLTAIASNHRLIMGHYSGVSLIAAGCTSIAIQVREPRARLLSLYRYWQAQSESVQASWGLWGLKLVAKANLPLGAFLADPETWPAVDNLFVRQALGYHRVPRRFLPKRAIMSSLYAEFRRRLPIVDWSSRSQEFLERICEELGTPALPALKRENETEMIGEEQRVDAATLRLLGRLTSVDRRFLDQLSADGTLPRRSSEDLDLEFGATASRLGFRLDR